MPIPISLAAYEARYASKYERLYHALRDAIVGGKLAYGDRIPSSRELANAYGFSRGTVTNVLEALTVEGYLATRIGAGTFVAYRAALSAPAAAPGREARLSEWGRRVLRSAEEQPSDDRDKPGRTRERSDWPISFRVGLPDMSLFPRDAWNRCLHEATRALTARLDEDTHQPLGVPALREAVAKHLHRGRGIAADARNVAIVNGSKQAIVLLAQLLAGPGDAVVAEKPGYGGIREAVLAAGAALIEGEVDDFGLRPQDWDANLLFVTPNRQYPTGAVLGMARRQRLLRWATERGAFIVEDEFDSEFRHRGKPLETLKSLDASSSVVLYVGTFSRTMMTDLRLGFVVLPDALVGPFARAKALYEPHPSAIVEQRALALFMNNGQYERHLRRMKRAYGRKFALLRDALRALDAPIRWVEGDAGLHVFGWWQDSEARYRAYEEACRHAGVEWMTRAESGPDRIGICLGFSHLEDDVLLRGVETMARVHRDFD